MKTKFLSVLAVTAILFASCNNDEDVVNTNDGQVKFTSDIAGPQLRVGGADGDVWTLNDPIGIYMVDNGSTTAAEGASNIEYKATTLTGGGKNATFTSTTPVYYPVNGNKVDFIAYHPYASVTDYVYKVNVAIQTNQSAIDLMRAFADGTNNAGYDKTNASAVNLNFKHQLSKVVMNVTPGAGVDNLGGLTISIKGMNTTADFDLKGVDGITNQDGVANSSITPFDVGSNTYEAILLPVATLDNTHIVEFTVGGNTYKWTMTDNDGGVTALATGNKYTFDVEIRKNAVVVSGTIDPWGNGGGGSGTAN